MSHLDSIQNPASIITPIEYGITFPEKLILMKKKYKDDVILFQRLVLSSESSSELLGKIRDSGFQAQQRMSLLKIFRRCVSLVCDTEMTKKIKKIPTEEIVKNYENTFKPISTLKANFQDISESFVTSLCVLLGEYDDRGKQGYILTELFFDWFEHEFPELIISGPIGAGRDIELSEVFPAYSGNYPCDFIITTADHKVLAIGFARYDSTRGGAQSDDRTSGNEVKVLKATEFSQRSGLKFKIIFLADGPGLTHNDTWHEACQLDDSWEGNVRVTTLALCETRVTSDWLFSTQTS